MLEFPSDLHYSEDHEWVRSAQGNVVRIGITEFATQSLGDIVYASLPSIGEKLSVGDSCGELESTKSVSDLYSPVAGVVSAVNEAVSNSPEAINSDPYGDGWLFEVELEADTNLDGLLDASQYANIAVD